MHTRSCTPGTCPISNPHPILGRGQIIAHHADGHRVAGPNPEIPEFTALCAAMDAEMSDAVVLTFDRFMMRRLVLDAAR